MGGVTLRVEKQNPVEPCHEQPECELQFILPVDSRVGQYNCYGACGRIEISRGEAELPAMVANENLVVAPCGREIIVRVDNQ